MGLGDAGWSGRQICRQFRFFSSLQNLRKNYASEKIKNITLSPGQSDFSTSQKYEKTAAVRSKTLHFDEDEALIRKTAGTFNAPIQYEQGLGKKGNRELYLHKDQRMIGLQGFFSK